MMRGRARKANPRSSLLTAAQRRSNDRAARADWRRRTRKEDSVLVDHRTYRIKPGHTAAHLDMYEKYGFEAQTRHLGKPFAYLYAESGDVNTIVHIWAYEDASDRGKRRAAMFADPQWQDFLRRQNEGGLLIEQKTSLMIPCKFAPIQR
jgi:NIPSNAP